MRKYISVIHVFIWTPSLVSRLLLIVYIKKLKQLRLGDHMRQENLTDNFINTLHFHLFIVRKTWDYFSV